MAASALLFDLDGTVWDSFPFYAAALAAGDHARHEHVLAQLRAARPAATLLRRGGISKRGFRGLCEGAGEIGLYPGVLPTLSKLARRGTRLGAVTNLPGWMAEPMLACQGLDAYLDSVVTYERTSQRKPHPAPLLLSCRELDVAANRDAWYLGDSPGDRSAAFAAGLSFAWAAWGYGPDLSRESHVSLRRFSDVSSL